MRLMIVLNRVFDHVAIESNAQCESVSDQSMIDSRSQKVVASYEVIALLRDGLRTRNSRNIGCPVIL
jgi:hypothetical protein